jgi:hypothetical protein
VMKIATGEIEEEYESDGKDRRQRRLARRAARRGPRN